MRGRAAPRALTRHCRPKARRGVVTGLRIRRSPTRTCGRPPRPAGPVSTAQPAQPAPTPSARDAGHASRRQARYRRVAVVSGRLPHALRSFQPSARRPVKQVDGEAQRVAPPAHVGIAPLADALEHRGHVGVFRLLARVALDRPAVLPFVLVPLVLVGGRRVHRDEPGVDARLHVAAVVEEFAVLGAQHGEVVRMRARAPVAFADQDVTAAFRPGLQLVADAATCRRRCRPRRASRSGGTSRGRRGSRGCRCRRGAACPARRSTRRARAPGRASSTSGRPRRPSSRTAR